MFRLLRCFLLTPLSFLCLCVSAWPADPAVGPIDSLEHLLRQPIHDTTRINTLVELAVNYRVADVSKAMLYITEAERIVDSLHMEDRRSKVYFSFGNIYLNKADYKNSLRYFMRALRTYEQKKKFEQASRCLNNIGVVYSYLGNKTLSEKYFRDALNMRETYGYTQENGILYSSIGFILSEKGELEESLKYYKIALKKGHEENDAYVQVTALSNLGNVNYKLGKLRVAKEYLNEALEVNSTLNDMDHQSACYQYLADIALAEKNPALAEHYLLLAKEYAIKAGINTKLMESYKGLADLYYTQERFRLAYDTRLLYEKLNDSALNENSYRQINELQTAYDVEKKNNQISLLNKDHELALANASRQHLLRNILIVLCCSILLIVFVLIRNVRLKQKLNRSLKTKNTELAAENIAAKYELLKSKVDPHFLFNSLNTLSSIVNIDKHKAIEFIEHFSTLYRSILELGDLNLLSLAEEVNITENYLYLQKVRFGDKLHVRIDTGNDPDAQLPPFAMQMAVENAIKHNIISAARTLSVNVRREGNRIIVENNLQKKKPDGSSTGIGQKTIRERYKLLTNDIPLFEETGTVYRVSLPLIFPNT